MLFRNICIDRVISSMFIICFSVVSMFLFSYWNRQVELSRIIEVVSQVSIRVIVQFVVWLGWVLVSSSSVVIVEGLVMLGMVIGMMKGLFCFGLLKMLLLLVGGNIMWMLIRNSMMLLVMLIDFCCNCSVLRISWLLIRNFSSMFSVISSLCIIIMCWWCGGMFLSRFRKNGMLFSGFMIRNSRIFVDRVVICVFMDIVFVCW